MGSAGIHAESKARERPGSLGAISRKERLEDAAEECIFLPKRKFGRRRDWTVKPKTEKRRGKVGERLKLVKVVIFRV